MEKFLRFIRSTPKWKLIVGGTCGSFVLLKMIYDVGSPWSCPQAKYMLYKAKQNLENGDNAWFFGRNVERARQDVNRLCR